MPRFLMSFPKSEKIIPGLNSTSVGMFTSVGVAHLGKAPLLAVKGKKPTLPHCWTCIGSQSSLFFTQSHLQTTTTEGLFPRISPSTASLGGHLPQTAANSPYANLG